MEGPCLFGTGYKLFLSVDEQIKGNWIHKNTKIIK